MLFFHKKEKACRESKPQEPDGIIITEKMRVYLIRNSQDNSVLGSILLSDSQFNMLDDTLHDMGIVFTRD